VAKFRLHGKKLVFSCTLAQLISDAVVCDARLPSDLKNDTIDSFPRNLTFIHHAQGNTFLIHFTCAITLGEDLNLR